MITDLKEINLCRGIDKYLFLNSFLIYCVILEIYLYIYSIQTC